jgi:hypothetical protein
MSLEERLTRAVGYGLHGIGNVAGAVGLAKILEAAHHPGMAQLLTNAYNTATSIGGAAVTAAQTGLGSLGGAIMAHPGVFVAAGIVGIGACVGGLLYTNNSGFKSKVNSLIDTFIRPFGIIPYAAYSYGRFLAGAVQDFGGIALDTVHLAIAIPAIDIAGNSVRYLWQPQGTQQQNQQQQQSIQLPLSQRIINFLTGWKDAIVPTIRHDLGNYRNQNFSGQDSRISRFVNRYYDANERIQHYVSHLHTSASP